MRVGFNGHADALRTILLGIFGAEEAFALATLTPGPSKSRRFIDGLRDGGYLNGSRKVDLSTEFAAARRLMGVS